nr:putative reverse transcriptase domain, ribonuclease H-like domain protein [Tanacetum cinerariifolium]
MRYMGFASWDLDKLTWEGRVEVEGTVPVCVCTGISWVRVVCLGGKGWVKDNTGGAEPQRKTSCFRPIPSRVSRESAFIFQNSKGVHRKRKFSVEPGSKGSIPEGHVIANFLAECPNNTFSKEPKETDPEGNEIMYALRFEFPTSNNESEYEALIASLELSIRLEVLPFAVEEPGTTWMDPIISYLEDGHLLKDLFTARKIRIKAPQKSISRLCDELNIKQQFISVAHPQANGQTEVTNRTLIEGLKTRLGKAKGQWVEELPKVLWAYHTTTKTGNHYTPFSLVYGSEAVLPPEIGLLTYRVHSYDEHQNTKGLRLNLDLLEERRDLTALRKARYKQHMEQYYNSKVHHTYLKVGDFVLRKNEACRQEGQRKLNPNWEGPYQIIEAKRLGTYVLKDLNKKLVPRTWHASNLRKFNF